MERIKKLLFAVFDPSTFPMSQPLDQDHVSSSCYVVDI